MTITAHRKLRAVLVAVLCLGSATNVGAGALTYDVENLRLDGALSAVARAEQIAFLQKEAVTLDDINAALIILGLQKGVRGVSVTLPTQMLPNNLEFFAAATRVVQSATITFQQRIRVGREELGDVRDFVQLPQAYSSSLTTRAATDIAKRLQALGYRDAKVIPMLDWIRPTLGTLKLLVEPGRLYRVKLFDWTGEQRVPDEVGGRSLRIKDKPWDADVLNSQFENKLVAIREAGYLDAGGELNCEVYTQGEVACRARLNLGPKFGISFRGNDTLSRPDLLHALDLDPSQRYAAGDLRSRSGALIDTYRRHGFYFSSATAAVTKTTARATYLTYFIDEGQRARFRGIDLRGVDQRTQERLLDALEITSHLRDVLFFGKTRALSQELRSQSKADLETALRNLGYLEGRVTQDSIELRESQVVWVVQIDPGPLYTWGRVRIPDRVGAEALDPPEQVTAAAPVATARVRQYSDRWRQTARANGYLDAAADVRYDTGDGANVIDVDVATYLGPQYRVRHVLVRGQQRTRQKSIRQAVPLRPGDLASQTKLVDGRRVLLERRVFRRIETRWTGLGGGGGQAIAIYDVVERNGGEFEIGLLFTTEEGFGVDLGIAHNRVFGTFRSIRMGGSVLYRPEEFITGDIFRQEPFLARAGLRYREPLPTRTPLFADATGTLELNRSDDDIDWLAQTVSLGPTFEPSEGLVLSSGYLYEWFKTLKVKQPEYFAAGIAVTDEVDRLGGVRTTMLYEQFDNRFDPGEGWGMFHDLQFFHESLAGEHRLFRYEGSIRYIQPVFGTVSFWFGGRGGIIGAASPEVPRIRSKVFRLGGSGSVRGYNRDDVSPFQVVSVSGRQVAVPVGGRWFASAQAEVRLGITDGLEAAIFEDTAYVGGFNEADVTAAGFGGGLLYHTPAGPIRLDVGRKIVAIRTDPSPWVIHFYISTTF